MPDHRPVGGRAAAAPPPAPPTVERDPIDGAHPDSARGGAPHAGFGVTDVLLLAMALIWGVNFSVVKFGTGVMSPLAFNGTRMLLAAAALGALALTMRDRWPTGADALRLLLLGVLGNGVYQLLFVEGIARTRAGNAALMLAATPVFVALIGRLLGVERAGWRAIVGILVSVAGIGLVVTSTAQGTVSESSVRGDLLVLAACTSWALYTVLLKPFTERVDGVVLSAVTMIGGAVPLALWASPSLAAVKWGSVPAPAWGAVVYSGLGALVIAYLCWYRGVRTLGPTRTAMYGNLQPVIALLVAWLTLGETPTAFQAIGVVLILGGVLMTRKG
ncbi:MAG TPA: DMT family transporter [Gemmatimonadales bacterium]